MRALRDRLAAVTIERLPYGDVIMRYDSPGALFYLDPPYDGTEGYGLPFGAADYAAMAEQLAGIRGQFVMSINDTPLIRETFARFEIAEIPTTWQLSAGSACMRVNELIVRSPAR